VTDGREGLEEAVRKAAVDNRISCRSAFDVASKEEVSVEEVGRVVNELGIKIVGCRLGCFR
jgi:hypothetical protein